MIGYREIIIRVGGDDDKDAVVRAAFVQLAGGVEISRTVAEHRGALTASARRRPELLQQSIEAAVVGWKKREQTEIIAVSDHSQDGRRRRTIERRLRGFTERQPDAVDLRVRLGQRQVLALFVDFEQQ